LPWRREQRRGTRDHASTRVTKNVSAPRGRKIALFAEFYNILQTDPISGIATQPLGPAGDLQQAEWVSGGIGIPSTIPISFQVQFGARVSSEMKGVMSLNR